MTPDADREPAERPAPSSKEDPESLALRAQPPRAIRFKRGAVVAIAAGISVALMATAWIALRPPTFELVADANEKALPQRPPADTLEALPSSYEDVPDLGPPLPGDLGRPILERQRANATDITSSETALDVGEGRADPDRQAADGERLAAERKAVRAASVLVPLRDRMETPAPAPVSAGLGPARSAPALARMADDGKAAFLTNNDTGDGVNTYALVPSASPDLLAAGSVIAASLITGINSDTPGLVIAQVTEQVFDSPTGRRLLIPQGARLIGRYDHVVAFGQRRALIVWQRILWPDGSSLRLDNVPAADPSGYAGLADKVDFHSWRLLQGVVMSTLLGVGANLTFSGESDLVRAIRESIQQNVARAGDQVTLRNLEIQPTITIRPGAPVRLVVHRDLILAPWKQ